MVVLFMVLFLGMWSLAARQIGTMLRIEQGRARRVQRDLDVLPVKTALAQALAALEGGYPPSSPYTCGVPVNGDTYAVTFERDAGQPDEWTIQAAPAIEEGVPLLDPAQFAATPPT
jgi:hypothetical protein